MKHNYCKALSVFSSCLRNCIINNSFNFDKNIGIVQHSNCRITCMVKPNLNKINIFAFVWHKLQPAETNFFFHYFIRQTMFAFI